MNKNNRLIFISASILLMIFIIILVPLLKGDMHISRFQNIDRENTENSEPDDNKNLNSEKKKFLIGFSQCNFSEPWRVDMNEQMKAAASKYPEFELIIKDGMQDNSKQISDIESLVQKKCDLILVSPNESKPLKDAIETVYNSGIPIILVDRKIDGDKYTQYIGADNYDIGRKAGEWIIKNFGNKPVKVVEILGSIGTSAQIDRHNGFKDVIGSYSNIKVIDYGSSGWQREKAIAVMEKILDRNADIDIVFAHNDPSAEGAYTAAKKAGREKNIKFIGIDGLSGPGGGISGVIDGRISVTYIYPSGAKEAIESAYKLLVKNETLEKHVKLDTMEVTLDNASEIINRRRLTVADQK